MEPITAAIYARISDDKHKDEQEGLNVDEQINACTAFIHSRGWKLGTVYRDDSISATSGAVRPDFERMVRDAPPAVVVWKQSRLERGHNNDLDRFLMAGCEGYTVDGMRITMENASGEFVTKMMSLYGKFEQRNKAEFQKQANLRLAKLGRYRGSIRPFGQNMDGSWIYPEAHAVIQAAKGLVAGTATFWDVAKGWNAEGLLTPQTGKQGGKAWTSGTVRNYFTRPRLMGLQDYAGTLYPLKDWKPLLDAETFGQIQTLINSKRTGQRGVSKGRGDAHLLTGILKCECGRGMNVGYRGAKGSPKIYRCPTVKHQSVTAGPLEKAVSIHTLQLLSQQDEGKAEAEEATKRIAELLDEKRVAGMGHSEWIDEAVEAGLKPALIQKRELAHAARLSELDAQVMAHRQALGANLFVTTFSLTPGKAWGIQEELTGWNSVSTAQRRDVLVSLFEGITVARGEQGKRFSSDRIDYQHTPLGLRLWDKWAEANTV